MKFRSGEGTLRLLSAIVVSGRLIKNLYYIIFSAFHFSPFLRRFESIWLSGGFGCHFVSEETASAQFHESSSFGADFANDQSGLINVVGNLAAILSEPVFQLVKIVDGEVSRQHKNWRQ